MRGSARGSGWPAQGSRALGVRGPLALPECWGQRFRHWGVAARVPGGEGTVLEDAGPAAGVPWEESYHQGSLKKELK